MRPSIEARRHKVWLNGVFAVVLLLLSFKKWQRCRNSAWPPLDAGSWHYPCIVPTPAGLQLGRWREWEFSQGPVPRRLWQTYKSRRPPKDGMDAYWSWHELNPGLQTIIHDDAQAHKCIKHLYGDEVSQIYAAFPLSVMRADFWRYAILYAFGGIYADIDVQALRPLDQWLPPEPDGVHWPPNNDTRVAPSWSDCSITIALQSDIFFCQWTIMSAPKHPVLRAVLELIIQRAKDGVDVTYEHFVHKHTGPGVWTDAIRQILNSSGGGGLNKVFHASWRDTTEGHRRQDMRMCLMGTSFFRTQNAKNLFGSQHFGDGFSHWVEESKKLSRTHSFM